VPQDADLIAGMIRGESGAFADLYEKYRYAFITMR
jgi:hypothetical protein